MKSQAGHSESDVKKPGLKKNHPHRPKPKKKKGNNTKPSFDSPLAEALKKSGLK
jgi:hypothetical protein